MSDLNITPIHADSGNTTRRKRAKVSKPAEGEYCAGYLLTGSILRQVTISELLERLDKAFLVASRIDARQQKLNGARRRSPVRRLAGLIKGIYNTLDREHGKAAYIHDVRVAKHLSAMSRIQWGGIGGGTPSAWRMPQAVLDREAAEAALADR
jgi:hypothetical protein